MEQTTPGTIYWKTDIAPNTDFQRVVENEDDLFDKICALDTKFECAIRRTIDVFSEAFNESIVGFVCNQTPVTCKVTESKESDHAFRCITVAGIKLRDHEKIHLRNNGWVTIEQTTGSKLVVIEPCNFEMENLASQIGRLNSPTLGVNLLHLVERTLRWKLNEVGIEQIKIQPSDSTKKEKNAIFLISKLILYKCIANRLKAES